MGCGIGTDGADGREWVRGGGGRSAAMCAETQNNMHRGMLSRIAEAHRSGCVVGGWECGGVGVGSAPLGAERWAMFSNDHNPTYRSGLGEGAGVCG